MLKKFTTKICALSMAALCFSLPLCNLAAAAPAEHYRIDIHSQEDSYAPGLLKSILEEKLKQSLTNDKKHNKQEREYHYTRTEYHSSTNQHMPIEPHRMPQHQTPSYHKPHQQHYNCSCSQSVQIHHVHTVEKEKSSSKDKLVGGLIAGVVLGAIIANANNAQE